LLKALDALGHDLTVLATDGVRRGVAEPDGYFTGTRIKFKFFGYPVAVAFFERKMRSLWRPGWELSLTDFGDAARREAQEPYDVILAENPETARIVENDPRTILSLLCLRHVDLIPCGDERESWSERFERMQASRVELSTCRRVNRIRVLSRRLEQILSPIRGVETPVPLCLDMALYKRVSPPQVPTVGVLGSMFWKPSKSAALRFIHRIVPSIRKARPDARYLVGGWKAKAVLGPHISDEDIEILDSFSDPREAFSRLTVLVYAPPIGTGMKVKILEAMAFGVPVVTNEEGFEGLEADSNPGVRLARTDEEIVAAVVDLLADAVARQRLIEDGLACLARTFSPMATAKQLERIMHKEGAVASL
jgi:glycosyltransferase involved in cell wall biosynthesis